MDSDWDSSRFPAGSLECLLCKESLDYVNGNRSDFVHHLMDVHQVKYHHNLILAVTFLDNATLNNIIRQFDIHEKSAKVYIDPRKADESLLEENNDPGNEKNVEETHVDDSMAKKKRKGKRLSDVKENVSSKKQKTHSYNNIEKEIEYEYVLNNSEYFKQNPKHLTTKCNLDLHSGDIFPIVDSKLPAGWKVRKHQIPGGSSEKHFLAPDGRVVKSVKGIIEYQTIMHKYSKEQVALEDMVVPGKESVVVKGRGRPKGSKKKIKTEVLEFKEQIKSKVQDGEIVKENSETINEESINIYENSEIVDEEIVLNNEENSEAMDENNINNKENFEILEEDVLNNEENSEIHEDIINNEENYEIEDEDGEKNEVNSEIGDEDGKHNDENSKIEDEDEDEDGVNIDENSKIEDEDVVNYEENPE